MGFEFGFDGGEGRQRVNHRVSRRGLMWSGKVGSKGRTKKNVFGTKKGVQWGRNVVGRWGITRGGEPAGRACSPETEGKEKGGHEIGVNLSTGEKRSRIKGSEDYVLKRGGTLRRRGQREGRKLGAQTERPSDQKERRRNRTSWTRVEKTWPASEKGVDEKETKNREGDQPLTRQGGRKGTDFETSLKSYNELVTDYKM